MIFPPSKDRDFPKLSEWIKWNKLTGLEIAGDSDTSFAYTCWSKNWSFQYDFPGHWVSQLSFTPAVVFHRVPICLQVQFQCSICQWKNRLMTMIHMHLIFWTAPNQLWNIHSYAWAREGLVMRNWLIGLHMEPQHGPQQEEYLSTAQGRAARLRARVKGSRSRTVVS